MTYRQLVRQGFRQRFVLMDQLRLPVAPRLAAPEQQQIALQLAGRIEAIDQQEIRIRAWALL